MSADIVVATGSTGPGVSTDRLLLLVTWLRRRDLQVEVVALGDGAALRRFRATAPTLVVDELRRKGPARLPYLVGARSAAGAIKSARLRRWLGERADATFLIHDPLAASLLRYMSCPPSRVVAGLPDPTYRLDRVRPEDLDTLRTATGWVVASQEQVRQVDKQFGVPAEVLGTMIDRQSLPSVRRGRGDGTVAVLLSAELWDQPDHGAELTWQLLRSRPATSVRWIVEGRTGRWLCEHDRLNAEVADVAICDADDPDVLDSCGVLVRAGYQPVREDLVAAAALAGVPVLDWAGDDVAGPPNLAPLDVEGAVTTIRHLLDHPDDAAAAGQTMLRRLADIDLDRLGLAVLDMLAPTQP